MAEIRGETRWEKRCRETQWGARTLLALFLMGLSTVGCVERTPPKKKGPRRRQLTPADHATIKKNILKKAPAKLSHPLNARLGDKAVYLGAHVEGLLKKGKPFEVTHYWKVVKPMPGWRLFTHLNGPGGKSSFVNVDHAAIGGRYPVTKWKPGQIIRDRQTINVPNNWAHKTLEIYTGIWKPKKGRLKVKGAKTDGHDRLLVASLTLGKRFGPGGGAAAPRPKAEKAPRRYVARRVKDAVKVDGKATEAAWKAAPYTEAFVKSQNGASAPVRTRAKLLWSDEYLYLLVECQDTDVWSTIKKRDGALWTQEAVELMVDADGDGATYIDLQVSPNGTVADSYLPRKKQGQDDWSSGAKVKVHVEGTLNDRDDSDTRWTVELALPMKAVLGRSKSKKVALPPNPGDTWRINLFRMDFPKGGSRVGLAWSPPKKPDFHTLHRFGELVFGDQEGKVPKAAPKEGQKDGNAKEEGETEETASRKGATTRAGAASTRARPRPRSPARTRPRARPRARPRSRGQSGGSAQEPAR